MDYARHTSRRLHAEHAGTLELLARFEQALLRIGRLPPPAADAAWQSLARALASSLATEVAQHFAFEENELFPRLAAIGEGDIGELLREEHVVINAVAGPLREQLRASLGGALESSGWQALRGGGLELVERLRAHIQKEERSLLPSIEDLLDEDTDRALVMRYTG